MAMRWRRKAANNGNSNGCLTLGARMYGNQPYAREVGHVGEAAGFATSAEVIEGHDVLPDVLTGVVHWLRKGGHNPLVKPTSSAETRWWRVTIATTTQGARLWANGRTSRFARSARPPGTAASLVRNMTVSWVASDGVVHISYVN